MVTASTRALRLAPLALLPLASPAAAQGPLQAPPAPAANPTTPEKAVLGKILFWDEQLSSDGTIACGTCHIPGVGGGDPRIDGPAQHPGPDGVGLTADDIFGSAGLSRSAQDGQYAMDSTFGHGVRVTGRVTPSNITGAYFPRLFWDGRAEGAFEDPLTGAVVIPFGGALEEQSIGPILNDVEMGYESRTWAEVTERLERVEPLALASNVPFDMSAALLADPTYPDLFEAAFGTDEITPVRIGFALAAYQRTLVPDQAKFDDVMRGQANFTPAENRGFGAFRSPGSRCDACHTPPLFADGSFRNLGLRPIGEDSGRFEVTGNPADRGRFKVPSLRNVALRDRFFHTGAPGIDDLGDVFVFYDQDGGAFPQNKDPLLNNLNVPPPVRADLVAFMNTLTDPRVASESYPFDRPTLWSERAQPNPAPTGTGAVVGHSLVALGVTATSPAVAGNEGFRIGLTNGPPGELTTFATRFTSGPDVGSLRPFVPLFRNVFVIDADGMATWVAPSVTDPALRGIAFQGQWVVRDATAPGGAARSELVSVTIE